jgi:aminobenzoyl-glutamate utilization protein B
MKLVLFIIFLILTNLAISFSVQSKSDANYVQTFVQQQQSNNITLAQNMWDWAELRFHEDKSSQAMQKVLSDQGFTIKTGVAGMPTAFVAHYGKTGPIIAILAEMDALPGLSQQALPIQQPIKNKVAGHACGHHLFGAGSVAAAVTVKNWLDGNNVDGQIRVYGTPAEEGGSGKVYMVRDGLFEDVDIALHWHAGDRNNTQAISSLANKTAKFRFNGIAAHAAISPEQGRSALDAVEAMNYMVNMMREHVPSDTRIHYVITDGGNVPNVVPETAEVYYYLRTPSAADLASLWERLEKTAKAAALGTETTVDWEIMSGVWSVLPNTTLAKVTHDAMMQYGGIEYTEEEQLFADTIRTTLKMSAKKRINSEKIIDPWSTSIYTSSASTDVGDISWNIPTAGFITATWVPGTAPHTWQAVAAGGMSIGHKGMQLAVKTLALSAINLYKKPMLIDAAKAELQKRKGEVKYEPQIGDRMPAL